MVGAVIILFVILMLYLNSLLQISSPDKAKYRMQQYLSSKYSEDFNINSPKYENGGFGIIGSWRSEAHPISNQKLKFDVGCTPSSDGTFGPSSCSDQYIAAIWSVQASKELESIVKEVNASSSNGYKADSAQAEIILSGDLVDSVNKQSKYEDNKTKDEGFLYRLIIDAPNDSQRASYVFKIVERLRQEGVYSVDVDVNRNNNSKIRCEVFFNKNKLGSKNDIESCGSPN
ncbi:hypothetical protein EUA75_01725 [TM7 phylum sp. oral taxon 353]|nr:hypothetical protein EUA75_01725 [TM7 phylum sp. oral taxon 353]